MIYRKYVPLVTYEVGLHDLRYTNEWRLFYLGNTRISHGYYWSLAENVVERTFSQEGFDFADRVASNRRPTHAILHPGHCGEGGGRVDSD